MDGTAISWKAAQFLKTSWTGECFMAVGAADTVLGLPTMQKLRSQIPGASELMVIEEGGHFIQEWGKPISEAALNYFGD
jgi:pimeloyl-ACP methyl ester carboxylesterase